jgi:hypothetical protein
MKTIFFDMVNPPIYSFLGIPFSSQPGLANPGVPPLRAEKTSFGFDHNGKVRAEKRAHPALLALFHLDAFRGEIPAGVHPLRLFQDFHRAKGDADPTALAISFFHVQFRHIDSLWFDLNGMAQPLFRRRGHAQVI